MRVTAMLIVAMLILSSNASAERDFQFLTSLENTQYHLHQSPSLDHDYHVYISLPTEIDADKTYPTIYLLDGGITFPLLAAYARYLRLADELPDLIIVGISYGTNDWRKGNRRSTDFTAPAESRDHYGGASAFQSMLKKELFPLVESNWPSDPQQRVLFGQSLGGQFAIYNALTEPDLFKGLIASNPALHRNLPFFLSAQANDISAVHATRLFVSMAEFDEARFRRPAQRWITHWQAQPDMPFLLMVEELPGHNHFSAAPEAFRIGLGWILDE